MKQGMIERLTDLECGTVVECTREEVENIKDGVRNGLPVPDDVAYDNLTDRYYRTVYKDSDFTQVLIKEQVKTNEFLGSIKSMIMFFVVLTVISGFAGVVWLLYLANQK